MSVVFRHKMFPLIIIYKDPEKSWDGIVKDRVIEEIMKDGFDQYTVINPEKAKVFLGYGSTVKKAKKEKASK